MKRRFLIGICISILFVFLVFRKVDFSKTLDIISSVNILFVLVLLFNMFLIIAMRSIRWKSMSALYRDYPIINFFEAISVGLMSTSLLPFRAGDLAQVMFLNYKTKLSRSSILSTVIIERLCDFFTIFTMLILGSYFILLPGGVTRVKLILLIIFVLLSMVAIFMLRNKLVAVIDNILPVGRFKDKVVNIIKKFYLGLDSVKKEGTFVKIIIYTLIIWVLYVSEMYICLLSVGININPILVSFIYAFTGLAVIIPSSPGYIGPMEFFFNYGLSLFDIGKNHIISFIVIFRMVTWLPQILLGLLVLLKNNVSIFRFSKISKST